MYLIRVTKRYATSKAGRLDVMQWLVHKRADILAKSGTGQIAEARHITCMPHRCCCACAALLSRMHDLLGVVFGHACIPPLTGQDVANGGDVIKYLARLGGLYASNPQAELQGPCAAPTGQGAHAGPYAPKASSPAAVPATSVAASSSVPPAVPPAHFVPPQAKGPAPAAAKPATAAKSEAKATSSAGPMEPMDDAEEDDDDDEEEEEEEDDQPWTEIEPVCPDAKKHQSEKAASAAKSEAKAKPAAKPAAKPDAKKKGANVGKTEVAKKK